MKKTIIVIGAGKGLGNAVARKFAQNGFRAVLMARNRASLSEYEREFAAEGFEAKGYALDATDEDAVRVAFDAVRAEFGEPDAVVYNVGITTSDPDGMGAEEIDRHFRADVLGAYSVIQAAADDGFAAKRGCIMLTGGVAAFNPFPGYLCLALTKAALRNLALAKHEELLPKGIFVGTVTVCGAIGTSGHFAPENIAEHYWQMYTERTDWELKYE